MSTSAAENNLTLHAKHADANRSVARLSILAAGFLIVLKTAIGFLTGSISVWASLLDSAMDILASIINFIAVRASSRPADEDHSYGHGKAESLAGLFQSLVIVLSGLFLIYEAVKRISIPHPTESEWVGITVMLIAILISLLLVKRLKSVSRETESPALVSDAVHYATDIYTNSGALLALLIVKLTGRTIADPLISILIAFYILKSAVHVAHESIDILMDRRLPAEIDEQVAEVVGRFRNLGVIGFHDLRTRRSGAQKFIDLHLEIEREQRLEDAHELAVQVIRAIEAEIPRSFVQIHTDPA